MSAAPSVVLFSTSVAVQAKTQADIARIKRILDAKRVSYEEVCFGEQRANVCAPAYV